MSTTPRTDAFVNSIITDDSLRWLISTGLSYDQAKAEALKNNAYWITFVKDLEHDLNNVTDAFYEELHHRKEY